MRIVLVHGFNVRDGGARSIDKLAPFLRAAGHEVDVDEADYGWFSFLAVRLRKHSAVVRIARALERSDAVVSHSNGSNYEDKALRILPDVPQKYRVVRLSPALGSSRGVAENVRRGWVFHTRSDWIVWLSGFLLFHPWGRQGWRGYRGEDSRIENVDLSDAVDGHSDWFDDEKIEFIAGRILKLLEGT